MAEVLTRADSLREYLTGAGSDGGAQADDNASLGGHRSSTEATSMSMVITSAIANITVDFASGGNAIGGGSLEAVDANNLRWKDLGGTYGTQVTIANGETKLLEAAGNPGAFIRVTRTSATNLVAGTATVTLSRELNNVFALDDVNSAEASAGDTEYRCTMIKNVSVGQVTNFKRWIAELGTSRVSASAQLTSSGAGVITVSAGNFDDWPSVGYCHIKTSGGSTREIVYYSSRTSTTLTVPSTGRALLGTSAAAGSATDTIHAVPGVAIGLDLAGVVTGTAADTVANENTAPDPAVTFVTGITAATGLSVASIDAGDQFGVWIKRHIPSSAVSTTEAIVKFNSTFDAA